MFLFIVFYHAENYVDICLFSKKKKLDMVFSQVRG